jgi:hypothetical protein
VFESALADLHLETERLSRQWEVRLLALAGSMYLILVAIVSKAYYPHIILLLCAPLLVIHADGSGGVRA